MIAIDGRRVPRQNHNLDPVDHLCLNGSVQSAPDQIRYRPAQGDRAAIGVLLNLREHVIIQIQGSSHTSYDATVRHMMSIYCR